MTSIRFGQILGISIELHSTFVLMIILLLFLFAVFDPQNLLTNMWFLFLLFLSVFLHELCHSITAVLKGIKINKITLLPIGGMTLAQEIPQNPLDELVIAFVGPLFNFIAAGIILAIATVLPFLWPANIFAQFSVQSIENALIEYPLFAIFWINFLLGSFNLFIPALPLDGGRISRAIISTKTGSIKATKIVSTISKFIAILLFLVGFFGSNLVLAAIAVFIFFGSNQETEIVLLKEALKDLQAKNATTKKAFKIDSTTTIENALKKMHEKRQTVFIVNTAQPSFISIEMLEKTKKDERDFTKIHEIAQKIPTIKQDMPLDKAYLHMLSQNTPFLAITKNNKIKGIISEEELQKITRIAKAQKQI